MRKSREEFDDSLANNIGRLETFWNRHSFHDEVVESVSRAGRRVVIRVGEYWLALTGAEKFTTSVKQCPTVWLYNRVTHAGTKATMDVETEDGELSVEFDNLRLIQVSDMSVVIPPLDPHRQ